MAQKIVPFVDHEIGYRLLHRLISKSSEGSIEILAVVTTSENGQGWWPSVGEICIQKNIPVIIYEKPFSEFELINHADWLLLLSWKHIIPTDLIGVPKNGVLNLHYSLLPSFRGVYPVNWAIINGNNRTGFTYHFVNENIDEGDVFMQVEVPVHLSDTARTLQLRIDDLVCDYFDEFINRLLLYSLDKRIHKQKVNSDGVFDYNSRVKFEKACMIDLNKKYLGLDLFNFLRGMSFFENSENAYVIDEESGKKIFVTIVLREEK